MPAFSFSAFLDATLAFLGSNPLALALVVTAAFIFVCELCFAYAQESARIKTERKAADRAASVDQAQRDLYRTIASFQRRDQ